MQAPFPYYRSPTFFFITDEPHTISIILLFILNSCACIEANSLLYSLAIIVTVISKCW